MRDAARRFTLVVAIVAICVAASGCNDDEAFLDDPSVSEIIAIGKEYLADERGAEAAEAFKAALKKDGDNVEATLGLFLSQIMQVTNIVDELAKLLSELDLGGAKSTAKDKVLIGDLLHDFFRDTMLTPLSTNETHYAFLVAAADFQYDFPRYALRVSTIELFSFSGEFDVTDVHALGAVNALFYGVVELLLAHDLNFDINALALPDFAGLSTFETIAAVLDLVEGMMASEQYPDFLALDENGVTPMQTAGVAFGDAFARMTYAFDALALERDTQGDDQFRFDDFDHDNRYDARDEPIYVGTSFDLPAELAVAIDITAAALAVAFYDESPKDIDPNARNPLSASDLNALLRALDVLPIVIGEGPRPLVIDGLPGFITIDIGPFFANPSHDGLRAFLLSIIDLVNFIDEYLPDEAA
ncbi:hypothetical protein K8I61_04835 [bacterium]|nr:hypothetical protein [bacterium]